MSNPKPIHIFRSGRHTDSGGRTIEFSDADVQAIAEAYDPALHEAPLVVGHPSSNGPAFGWVSRLDYADGNLSAVPQQLAPEFVEWVRAGRLKKVSASFYPPGDVRNPVADSFYLRHVGFLGAQPPAIKGLRAVDLSDAEHCIEVELDMRRDFSDADGWTVRKVFRQLREWLISTAGQEVADQVVPDWAVESVEREEDLAQQPPVQAYAEKPNQQTGDAMPQYNEAEVAAQIEQLKEREAALAAREAKFAEAERNARQAGRAAAIEALVNAGKIVPADKDGLMLLFAELDEAALDFAEGKKPACDWLLGYLGRQPVQIDYSERAPAEQFPAAVGSNLPSGAAVSPERLELHQRALAYAEKHEVDYLAAVLAVEKHQ